MAQQRRFIICAVAAIVGIWALVLAGHWYLENTKMTAEKVRAYMESVDFASLTGDARARAIKELEDKLNALSFEERRRLRLQHLLDEWFKEMTEAEKSQFVEATMPTGFKQAINNFAQLPEKTRRKLIDNALSDLRNANAKDRNRGMLGIQNGARGQIAGDTNAPVISPQLEAEIRNIGLNTFYSQSSAETKAELAPVLEEMQHQMAGGGMHLQ